MATTDPTRALVSRAQAGDRSAFDEIVERFRARLEHQIRSRMSETVRLQLDADDILNETFACAFESIARLEWQGEETFYRWLGSIAEHLIRNASRKKSWTRLRLEREAAAADTSPSRRMRRDERFDRLEKALNRLSPDHKRALVLSRIEGLKVSEISQKMNRSTNAVKKLLARALEELRRSFGDTESLHLPDRRLEVEGVDDDA
jgi:RNA polymerase sigma-70 factor (ECF subfamily)